MYGIFRTNQDYSTPNWFGGIKGKKEEWVTMEYAKKYPTQKLALDTVAVIKKYGQPMDVLNLEPLGL